MIECLQLSDLNLFNDRGKLRNDIKSDEIWKRIKVFFSYEEFGYLKNFILFIKKVNSNGSKGSREGET